MLADMPLKDFGREREGNMGQWQNLDRGFFEGTAGKYDFPVVLPTYEIPKVEKYTQFSYINRLRRDRVDRSKYGVHFFEHDFKFESCWTRPDRYAQSLQEFGFVIGPDFSTYIDFPKAVCIYNHYRNNWLVRYWQILYNIIIVPTVLWGLEDSYEYCFDGLPQHSIVAVSTVGLMKEKGMREMFHKGYNEMLKRLEPLKILCLTRNYEPLSGNVEYIPWELYKEAQRDGNRQ